MSKWIERIREKEGRKGLVPWLSVTVQKWVLIGVACMATLVAVMSIGSGVYLPVGLVFTIIAAFTFYVGFKTNWLKSIDRANKPVRIAGAFIVVAGVVAVLIYLAIAVFYVLIAIFVLFALLVSLFGSAGSGKRTVKQDGRTYRKDWMGNWNADKDILGNDKVERNWLGNPKIRTDWKGDQKIETDWKGDPLVPPRKNGGKT